MDLIRLAFSLRRASVADLERMILKKIERNANASTLLSAYIEALAEEWEDEHGDMAPELADDKLWYKKNLGYLEGPAVEKLYRDTYLREYRRRVPWASADDAVAVYEFPLALPDEWGIDKLLRYLATQVAVIDALEARELRNRAMRSR
jgi:hypothetical protein